MKTAKFYLLLIVVFIIASLLATYFEFGFRVLVIRLCTLLTNHKIHFSGKNFLFFPTLYFELFFSLFSTIIVFRLIKMNNPRWLFRIFMVVVLFGITITVSCWMYAETSIMECTACNNGERTILYRDVPYNTLFFISLIVPLLAFFISDTLGLRKAKSAKKLA